MSRKPVLRILAPTWEATELGAVNSPSDVRESAKGALKSFISDFKGENP
jgi:hypothetical protein